VSADNRMMCRFDADSTSIAAERWVAPGTLLL